MPGISDELGLELPIRSEDFSPELINRNYTKIDKSIGDLGGAREPFNTGEISGEGIGGIFSSNLDNFNVMGEGVSYVHRFGNVIFYHIEGTIRSVQDSASGNIGNTNLGTVATQFRPAAQVPIQTVNDGPLMMGYIARDGSTILTAIAPGVKLSVGERIALAGWGYIN